MGCTGCAGRGYPRHRNAYQESHKGSLMVVGDRITAIEAINGEVMTGDAAKILKQTLQDIGFPYLSKDVYYTTAVKCAVPADVRDEEAKEDLRDLALWQCGQYLHKEIEELQPRMVLLCGAASYNAFYGEKTAGVMEAYGRPLEQDTYPNTMIIPIMHPASMLFAPGDYKPFKAFLDLAYYQWCGGKLMSVGDVTYDVLETEKDVDGLLSKLHSHDVVTLDIETTDLDYRYAEFCVMGIFVKGDETHAYVLPRHLRNRAKDFYEDVPWTLIWQNGMYDKKVLWRRGLGQCRIDEDTMLKHYTLDETSQHDLGHLSKIYLQADSYKYKMNQEFKAVTLDTYDHYFEALCERAAVDVVYTSMVNDVFDVILGHEGNEKLSSVYYDMLIPAANMLGRVEQNGILLDMEYLKELDKEFTILVEDKLEEIVSVAAPYWDRDLYMKQTGAKSGPEEFNPNSPQQVAWMLYDVMKLRPRIMKGRSTAVDILESIENPPEIVTNILELRSLKKEHSTYIVGLMNAEDTDGRVRTGFTLHVTATGRLSSKEPNIQNQPSVKGTGNVRRAFIPEKGYIISEIDYSGAELRWLAARSGCEVLSEIFIEGRNLHDETSRHLYGPDFTEFDRMRAKAVNFGIPYGREAGSLAEEFDIPLSEAREMIENWLNSYPGARDFLQWCADQVEEGNSLETPFGRRRRFGLVTRRTIHGLQNQARNFIIQSSSSDTLLVAVIANEDWLAERGVRILNLIHDSVLLEIPADPEIIMEVAIHMNREMSAVPKERFGIEVPFQTDVEIGTSWGVMSDLLLGQETEECVSTRGKDKLITLDEWLTEVGA